MASMGGNEIIVVDKSLNFGAWGVAFGGVYIC